MSFPSFCDETDFLPEILQPTAVINIPQMPLSNFLDAFPHPSLSSNSDSSLWIFRSVSASERPTRVEALHKGSDTIGLQFNTMSLVQFHVAPRAIILSGY